VVCGGEIRVRRKGAVAPFLARRVWNRGSFPVNLMQCRRCEFMFFNPRMDSEEEGRLYAQYRSEEYRRMRHSVEPWYTQRFNLALSAPHLMEARRQILSELLQRQLAGRKIATVLDFGGDRGGLVRALIPGATPYVYDISAVEPEPGVQRGGDLAACRARQFDLVVNSNVLEHVGFPRLLLEQIRSVASPQTLVFLEVPFESPLERPLLIRRAVQWGLLAVSRPRVAASLASPRALCLMHEHVNYFDSKSLEALLRTTGWTVLASGSYQFPSNLGGKMGWSLARCLA
jgi:hypothetical protein